MTPEAVLSGEARWCLVTGDCREILPTLPDGSVHHVMADPPYSRYVHAKSRAGALKQHNGDPLRDGQGRISPSAISRAKEFGFAPLTPSLRRFCSREFARLTTRWVIVFSDLESATWWRLSLAGAGLDYVRTMPWVKLGCTPQFTGDRPAVAAEAMTLVHTPGRKKWNGGGKRGIYECPIELDRYGHGRVVRVHPTQKPEGLMEALVRDFTDPGDIVLDPFAGAATTGVACLKLGRRFIGFELDPAFAKDARARLTRQASRPVQTDMTFGDEGAHG